MHLLRSPLRRSALRQSRLRAIVALTLFAVLGSTMAPGITRMLGRAKAPQLLVMQLCHGDRAQRTDASAQGLFSVAIERGVPVFADLQSDCPSCALHACGSAPLPAFAVRWTPRSPAQVAPLDPARAFAADSAFNAAVARGPPQHS